MSVTRQQHGHGHGPAGPSEEDLARSVATGHELTDARSRPLLVSGAVIFGVIIFSFVIMGVFLALIGNTIGDTSNTLPQEEVLNLQLPPEPRLEQNPRLDGDRIVEQATTQLETYGWMDKRANMAHIPIERAMELIVEKGVGPQE